MTDTELTVSCGHPTFQANTPSSRHFAGSESYWLSYTETAFGVMEAPEPTVAPTNPPASVADQYLLPGIGGIIAAIAVVGIAIIALLLRRK